MELRLISGGSDDHRVEFVLDLGHATERIWYEDLSGKPLRPVLEAGLSAGMVPAMMRGGGPLKVQGEVDELYLRNQPLMQDIWTCWFEEMARVTVTGGRSVYRERAAAERVGTFFTCGMDSYYTLLKHQDEITDLIYVYGLDVKLTDTKLRQTMAHNLRVAADAMGKQLIELASNVREVMDRYAAWGPQGAGGTLAATGHLLGGRLSRIYIPATYTYAQMIPWSSHPLLDRHWSSHAVTFTHDGCEASRPTKAASIVKSDVALQTLHVCWQNPDSLYNCGRCEKCIRTQINLLAAGGLDRCTTFAKSLSVDDLHRVQVTPALRLYIAENQQAIAARGEHDDLARALQELLDRPPWRTRMQRWWRARERSVRKRVPFLHYDPHAPR